MVAAGFALLFLLVYTAFSSLKNVVERKRWLLKLLPWTIPLPFIACEAGWITTEMGRQPWAVYGMLPTWEAASSHSVGYMIFSLCGFVLLYSAFIAVEMALMFKFARQGPDENASR
jgi:cytochrome d ubiquinol oxidase subunit I